MYRIIIYLYLGFLFSCGGTGTTPVHESIPTGWKEIRSNKGKYIILFPDYPIEEGSLINLWNGRKIETYYCMVNLENQKDDNIIYSIDFSFHPDVKTNNEIDEGFEEQKRHILSLPNIKLLNESIIDDLDYKGREMLFIMPEKNLNFRYRIFFYNGIFYKLMVMTTNGKIFNKSASEFINSFMMIN
jgi:hypothetical protein